MLTCSTPAYLLNLKNYNIITPHFACGLTPPLWVGQYGSRRCLCLYGVFFTRKGTGAVLSLAGHGREESPKKAPSYPAMVYYRWTCLLGHSGVCPLLD